MGALFIEDQTEVEMNQGDAKSISLREKETDDETGIAVHNHPSSMALFSESDYAAFKGNSEESFPMLNVVNSEGVGLFVGTTKLAKDNEMVALKRDILKERVNVDSSELLRQLVQWEVVAGEQAGERFHLWGHDSDLQELRGLSVVKREDAMGLRVNWVVFIPWADLDQAIQAQPDLTFRSIAFEDGLPKLLSFYGVSDYIPVSNLNLHEALGN